MIVILLACIEQSGGGTTRGEAMRVAVAVVVVGFACDERTGIVS